MEINNIATSVDIKHLECMGKFNPKTPITDFADDQWCAYTYNAFGICAFSTIVNIIAYNIW